MFFIIKKEKKLIMKKAFQLETTLRYWTYFKFFRQNSLIIFCQKPFWSSKKDLDLITFLRDRKIFLNTIRLPILKKIFNYNLYIRIHYCNTLIRLKNLKEFKNLDKVLTTSNFYVLGYYFNNIFFYKKDFKLSNLKKIKILEFFLKKKNILNILQKKIIFFYKILFYKLIKIFINIRKNGNI